MGSSLADEIQEEAGKRECGSRFSRGDNSDPTTTLTHTHTPKSLSRLSPLLYY